MKMKLFVGAAAAVIALATLGGVALATQASGFVGVTVAKGTFGNVFSLVHYEVAGLDRADGIPRRYGPVRPGEHVAARRHDRLAHASGPELRGRDPGHRDRVRGRTAASARSTSTTWATRSSIPATATSTFCATRRTLVATTTAVQFVPATAARRIDVDAPKACGDIK